MAFERIKIKIKYVALIKTVQCKINCMKNSNYATGKGTTTSMVW